MSNGCNTHKCSRTSLPDLWECDVVFLKPVYREDPVETFWEELWQYSHISALRLRLDIRSRRGVGELSLRSKLTSP